MSQIMIELDDHVMADLKTKLSKLQIGVDEYISRLVRRDIKKIPKQRELSHLSGNWTDDDGNEFDKAMQEFNHIDWREWEGMFTPEEQKSFDEIYERTGDLDQTYQEFERFRK